AAADAAEPPAWAQAMSEELGRLREENRGLRVALHGLVESIDRQIAALEEGRVRLRRAVGEAPREEEGS
ncbi:MAG TPA: hypothetical protein VN317_00535, partial [Candidatus Methanoperedens sp.]|nr:hypothetical protein [Candidatus Methanoperedens sp.]